MTRVAVVEDDAETRGLVQAILGERGYEVQAFPAFAPAWAELARAAPDLLITDVNLPDGSGLELVARLRALHSEVFPCIVLSALTSEQDFLRGFAAGACDYLAKPFTGDELLARCAIHLGRGTGEETTAVRGLPQRDGLVFRRYEVRGVLGRGTSGIVYDAVDSVSGEPVALKVLTTSGPTPQAESRLRFLRETYALSAIDHPHVVRVRDFGAAEGRLFYAMERVAGTTLRDRVRLGPLCAADARDLLRGLASALAALEKVDIVHRDLTPPNVMLKDGLAVAPVIVDFGLAKRSFDHGLTVDDLVLGTPGFVPPEVVRGLPHDARGDLFALGAVVLHALGVDPFPALRGLALLQRMTTDPLPVPEGLPADLRVLLASLVAIDPAARPASAREVLADLDE